MEKYYQILGVDRNASPDEIKQAYYDLVLVWRSDKYLHDPRLHEKAISKLKNIDEAYLKILEFLKLQQLPQGETKPLASPKQQTYQEMLDVSFTEYPSPDIDRTTIDTRYKGVKGWLFFLCCKLILLQPFFGMPIIVAEYRALVSDYPDAKGWILLFLYMLLGLIGFGIYAGISLWKVKRGAVSITKKYFITKLVLCSVTFFFLLAVNSPHEAGKALGAGLVTAGWLLYLNKSKRVRATYES